MMISYDSHIWSSNIVLLELASALTHLRPGSRMLVIKTLTNSWATSSRLHEPRVHKCLFRGLFSDDLGHHLVCNTLWDILCSAAKLDRTFLDLTPLQRVCIVDPNPRKLLLVACAFRAYHAIKLQHLEFALSAHSPFGDPLPLYELVLDLAVYHLKELNHQSIFSL